MYHTFRSLYDRSFEKTPEQVFINSLKSEFELSPAYPNPFNAVTNLSYDLPIPSPVSIRVYDVSGCEVATLVDAQLAAGRYEAVWNAPSAPAGVYLVRMEVSGFSAVRKLMLIK